jgi:phthalate 4,5-cis-dihydrodiol dehydrogenase
VSAPRDTTRKPLRLGVAGLGRAFTIMLPTFVADRRVELVAAADPHDAARERFASEFGGETYASVVDLCRNPDVEVVYVATPHELHAEHAVLAAQSGKHLLIEKPLAISIDECRRIEDIVRKVGVAVVVGHSHSFDRPIRYTRELIASGRFGRMRMITAMNYTDFLYRPRRPAELDTRQGGGVLFSQAAHQVDIVRLLAGSPAKSVRAALGAWDRDRPTEGAYSALLQFENGAYASLSYSGYGHFDSDELCGWVGELGQRKEPDTHGSARRALGELTDLSVEADLKSARNYGGTQYVDAKQSKAPVANEHFGMVVVSCEHADLRPLPSGIMVYTDGGAHLESLGVPKVPRGAVIDELYDAIVLGRDVVHDVRWATATLEVCVGMLRSGREQREITLVHQQLD